MLDSSLFYVQEAVDYLNSIVIKFTPFETLFNGFAAYLAVPGFNDEDPTTFPYYRILGGDTAFATVPLYGYSPNLQSEVLLTRANVIANPDIVSFYQTLDNLKVLLDRYPNDQFIIRRVLNPVVDIAGAIDADNLTILDTSYQDEILNPYEEGSIVSFLQQQLYMMSSRWYIPSFEFEDRFSYAFWSMLWLVLPNVILTKRIMNIKTIDVHPYHIWQYLTSMGFGSYNGYLSHSQELFLYRNARYLKWNAGKQFLLDILEEEFLLPIAYSLTEKTIVASTYDRQITHDKYPNVVPRLGNEEEFLSSSNFSDLLNEIYISGNDYRNDPTHITDVTNAFIKSPTNKLQTKFLEFNRNIDLTEISLLTRFLLDSIVYLCSVNLLRFPVVVVSPVSQESIGFSSVLDALNLIYYCIYSINGIMSSTTTVSEISPFSKYTSTAAVVHASAPTISKSAFVDGYAYNVSSDVDIDTFVNEFPYIDNRVYTPEDLSDKLGNQFKKLFDMINWINSRSSTVENDTLLSVFQTLVPKKTVVNVVQDYTTYTDYFKLYKDVLNDIKLITDPSQYDDYIYAIITAICPLKFGFTDLEEEDQIVSTIIQKIKDLFTYLVSYNITFISTAFDDCVVTSLPKVTANMESGEDYQFIGSLIMLTNLDNNSGTSCGGYQEGVNTSCNNKASIAGRDPVPSNTLDYRIHMTETTASTIDLDIACASEIYHEVSNDTIDVPTECSNDVVLSHSDSSSIFITCGNDITLETID